MFADLDIFLRVAVTKIKRCHRLSCILGKHLAEPEHKRLNTRLRSGKIPREVV